MNISANWTEAERSKLINKKCQRINALLNAPLRAANPARLSRLVNEIDVLTNSTAQYLELHRDALLEGID